MIGIVIVAHGGLAAEYLAAMEHVVGAQPGTRAISISRQDNLAEKEAEIGLAINDVDEGDGVVLVTDLFGGTPSNLAICACNNSGRKVIYGANLPLLLQLAKTRHLGLEESCDLACKAGHKYMNYMDPCKKAPEE